MLITDQSPKEGTAQFVETTVESMVNNHSAIDQSMENLSAYLAETFKGAKESAAYNRAKRMRQAVYATLSFEAARIALPNIASYHNQHQTLLPDEAHTVDVNRYLQNSSSLTEWQRTSVDCGFLFVDAVHTVLNAMQEGQHPASDLYSHLNPVTITHEAAWQAWQKSPSGRNRWPYYRDGTNHSSEDKFVGAFCTNLSLAASLCAAKAAHHLHHVNSNASISELDEAVRGAIPSISWAASSNRHLGWQPDWRELPARLQGISPLDGVEALMHYTAERGKPGKYSASLDGMALMRNADFCPHPSLKNGPIAKAASCTGDVRVRYADAASRMDASNFFETMGFDAQNGEMAFSMTAVVLAMGRRIVRDEVLPAYIQTR